MKLTVQRVMDVLPLITAIINEKRPMPQKGKYRLARLHAKLLPEFTTASAQRDDMIKAYDTPLMVSPKPSARDPLAHGPAVQNGFTVPDDKIEEFSAAWKAIGDEQIEIDAEPIPLAQLDLGDATDGAIHAHELVILGDLVTE